MDVALRTRAYFEALGSGTLDELLAFYAPEAIMDFPGALPSVGGAQVRALHEAARGNMLLLGVADVRFDIRHLAVDGREAFVEWSLHGHSSLRGELVDSGVKVLTWNEGGQIVRAATYANARTRLRYSVGGLPGRAPAIAGEAVRNA